MYWTWPKQLLQTFFPSLNLDPPSLNLTIELLILIRIIGYYCLLLLFFYCLLLFIFSCLSIDVYRSAVGYDFIRRRAILFAALGTFFLLLGVITTVSYVIYHHVSHECYHYVTCPVIYISLVM